MFLVLSSVPFASTSACDCACSMHMFLASFEEVDTTAVFMGFFGGGGVRCGVRGKRCVYVVSNFVAKFEPPASVRSGGWGGSGDLKPEYRAAAGQ